MSTILEYVRDHREKIQLVVYFIMILVLAVPLSRMLNNSWYAAQEVDGISVAVVRVARFVVFGTFLDSSHKTVTAFVFGIFLAFLVLMTIDPKKRWQAALLWIGSIPGLAIVAPGISPSQQIPAFILGFIIAVVIGGGKKLLRLNDSNAIEFRRASKGIYFMLFLIVVLGFIEYHLRYPSLRIPLDSPMEPQLILYDLGVLNRNTLLVNLAVSALFIATVRRFVKYDTDKDFFILGPRASGKSLFLIGLYMEALERYRSDETNTPLRPSQDLMSMMEALDKQNTEWIVEATGRGELQYLNFRYVHGKVFPANIEVSAMDYAGEYLRRLPDAITGAMGADELDNTLRRLRDGVQSADNLILVVDVERFENNEPLEISEYFSILQSAGGQNAMLVATKADVLAEEFKEERGLEAHTAFDEFTEFINRRLRQSENVDALVAETAGNKIYPVYYQTKTNENGDRVPMRDENGRVMTVGFDEFLQRMGEI